MIMDLRELQDEYMKDFRKVTREKLLPGALIESNFTDEEIVIKDGRYQKPKKIIIIGYDQENDTYYGSVFINTNINPRAKFSQEFLSSQYLIKKEDYDSFLRYDSYVDCAGIIPCSTEKLLSGDYYGTLNEDDRKNIWDILETTDTLTTKQKKRFGIRRR